MLIKEAAGLLTSKGCIFQGIDKQDDKTHHNYTCGDLTVSLEETSKYDLSGKVSIIRFSGVNLKYSDVLEKVWSTLQLEGWKPYSLRETFEVSHRLHPMYGLIHFTKVIDRMMALERA